MIRSILIATIFVVSTTLQSCVNRNENKYISEPINSSDSIISDQKLSLPKPYNPKADAKKDLDSLVNIAKGNNKKIMIQVGGNWCIWCLKFEKFRIENADIKSLIDNNYLYYHLNYSEENKNEIILKELGNPGQYGYPVFVILNNKGENLHIQSSETLEDGKDYYNKEKVIEFFEKWK